MEWIDELVLAEGDSTRISTLMGELSLTFREGVLEYSRPDFEHPESAEPVRKTLIMDSLKKKTRVSLLPQYPDRPLVFKLDSPLAIPPGHNGFFCLTMTIGIGLKLISSDTLIEELLPKPRKNSYWGPPNNGLLTYQIRSPIATDPIKVCEETDLNTAVIPVYYKNRREEGDEVTKILVPSRELDLYKTETGDLVFEVVQLTHQEEFYQEPRPRKRAPKEMKQQVKRLMRGPIKAESLFEKVRSLPKLDSITNMFVNR